MDSLFPKRIVVVGTVVTLSLIVGLLGALRSSIGALQEIQNREIPIIEMTSIQLRWQELLDERLENMVEHPSTARISSFLEDREFLLSQVEIYLKLLADERAEDSKNHDLKNLNLPDRKGLGRSEDEIIAALNAKDLGRAQALFHAPKHLELENNFRKPFQDTSELMAERRDQMINTKIYQHLGLLAAAVGCLVLLGFLWVSVVRAFWRNLKLRVASEMQLAEERVKVIHSAKLATLGEMAGGIAHEINNPLTIIIGTLSRLQQQLKDDAYDRDKWLTSVEKLQKTTDRIRRIVRGLKTFSRDGSKDPFEPCDLASVITDSAELISGHCKRYDIEVILHPEQYRLEFEARAVEISQVLVNLVSNSIDAIREQSEKWIDISVQEDSKGFKILITDAGPGIPPEVADKIFNPFFTTKPVGEGTGLGLSIIFGIIANHGGKIGLDRECANTRFVVEFPKKQKVVEKILSLA